MKIWIGDLDEQSFEIAWEYLAEIGELASSLDAEKFLNRNIGRLIRHGSSSRLLLSNRAIAAHLGHKIFRPLARREM